MSKTDPAVQAVGDTIAGYMERIATLFKPGVKITVVVRRPDYPDGSRDMILSDDDPDGVVAAVEKWKARR